MPLITRPQVYQVVHELLPRVAGLQTTRVSLALVMPT